VTGISRRGLLLALVAARAAISARVGPSQGTLIVIGGGDLDALILGRFLAAAGGPDARILFVPTAGEKEHYAPDDTSANFLKRAGCRNLEILHTRDRREANTEAFAARVRDARGIFFGGGRQWRLVDSYSGTRTQREFEAVLRRGGVIAGTSAGATIQGSYLVRGAREGNTIMMAPGYEQGFGYLRGVAIDQHLLKRGRENDLVAVIDKHPELLGIGIDENTAIVVQGDRFEVIGISKVAIYDRKFKPAAAGEPRYYFLKPGDRFDLVSRRVADSTIRHNRITRK
jgi:cyanophycinase